MSFNPTKDASVGSKGVIQLAGDLGGVASSPTVPGLANKADTSAVVTLSDDLATEALQRSDTDTLHAEATDPHVIAKYAIMPDGGRHIWTRTTDPGGLAVDGDIWFQ